MAGAGDLAIPRRAGVVAGAMLGGVASGVHASEPVAVVLAFHEAINRRDLDALTELMTESHRFVDSAGAAVEGRSACTKAWRGFFESFPDYRNVFDDVVDHGAGVVVASGRSTCSVFELDGPAEWRAVVDGTRVDEWHVSEPAPGTQ